MFVIYTFFSLIVVTYCVDISVENTINSLQNVLHQTDVFFSRLKKTHNESQPLNEYTRELIDSYVEAFINSNVIKISNERKRRELNEGFPSRKDSAESAMLDGKKISIVFFAQHHDQIHHIEDICRQAVSLLQSNRNGITTVDFDTIKQRDDSINFMNVTNCREIYKNTQGNSRDFNILTIESSTERKNRESLVFLLGKVSTVVYRWWKNRLVPFHQLVIPIDLFPKNIIHFSHLIYQKLKFCKNPKKSSLSLVIANANIRQLYTKNLKFEVMKDAESLHATYKNFALQLSTFEAKMPARELLNPITISNFTAKNIKVFGVFANSTITNDSIADDFRRIDDENQDHEFLTVTVTSKINFLCPIPAVNYRQVSLTGLVNGLSFKNLPNELLLSTTTVDQTIIGFHSFQSLRTNEGNFFLDVATNFSHQKVQAGMITTRNLILTTRDFFLPKIPVVTHFPRTLRASRVKIKNLIDLRGMINGSCAQQLGPSRFFQQTIDLNYPFAFGNVKVLNILEAHDLVGEGKSLKIIKSKAIPLNSTVLPVHTHFTANRVVWSDVSTLEQIGKWIVRNNGGSWNVTGTKIIPADVISSEITNKLATAEIKGFACVAGAIADGIFTTSITADHAWIRTLKVEGNGIDLRKSLKPLLRSSSSTDSAKSFDSIENPIIQKLNLKALRSLSGIRAKLPSVIRSFDAKRIIIKRINGNDVQEAIHSVVRDTNSTSLMNITFADDVEVRELIAKNHVITTVDDNLGAKTVEGLMSMENLVIPNETMESVDEIVNLIVHGDVTFVVEPTIRTINHQNLRQLIDNIWMANKPTKLDNTKLLFKQMNFESFVDVHNLQTENSQSWSEIAQRIFSKTRDQTINQSMTVDEIQVKNLFLTEKSKLTSRESVNLHNLEYHTIKKHGANFIERGQLKNIRVTERIEIIGNVNDLNLNNDVLRMDVENVISAEKVVGNLIAENVNGLGFREFVENTVKIVGNGGKFILNEKTFANIRANDIRVGTVNSKVMENFWHNETSKNIVEKVKFRKISGNKLLVLHDLVIGGVNLTDVMKYQLREDILNAAIAKTMELAEYTRIIDNVLQSYDINSKHRVTMINQTSFGLDYCRLQATTLICNDRGVIDLTAIFNVSGVIIVNFNSNEFQRDLLNWSHTFELSQTENTSVIIGAIELELPEVIVAP